MKTIPINPIDALPTTCASSELLALQVLDDSMAPEFSPGQVVVIDGSARLVPGAYVLVQQVVSNATGQRPSLETPGENCSDWKIRRWNPVNAHQVELETLNADWDNERVNACDVKVQGVVVQRAGRRRAEHRHYR